jgi:hypothetical protein
MTKSRTWLALDDHAEDLNLKEQGHSSRPSRCQTYNYYLQAPPNFAGAVYPSVGEALLYQLMRRGETRNRKRRINWVFESVSGRTSNKALSWIITALYFEVVSLNAT